MIKMKDYEDTEGNLDWRAYNEAQVAAGEKCSKCHAYISFSKGRMTECNDCKTLDQDHGEVSHDDFIRCPRCGHTHYAHDGDSYEILADGEHGYSCMECNYDFEITTHVSFTFNSPERLEGWHACDRCEEWYEEAKGDGYCGLCPKCADETEPEDEDDEGAPEQPQDNKDGNQDS